jgi:hypothetical protein
MVTRKASIAFLALAAACVDPSSDYDSYISRTNDLRGRTTHDSGPADVQALDGGFSHVYYTICLPLLAAGHVDKALRFQSTATYTQQSANGGSIVVSLIPLTKDATDLSQTVGNTIAGAPVGVANNKFDLDLGAPVVPAAANPISNNDIVFKTAVLHYTILSPDRMCAILNGEITQPLDTTFDGDSNPCISISFPQPSGALPSLTAADIHCP